MDILEKKIPASVFHLITEKKITSLEQLMQMDELDIWQITQLNYTEFKQFLVLLSQISNVKKFQSVASLPEWTRISTCCDHFDRVLNGGIPTQQIVEIYGPSGAGKTQIALQLCLAVQLPSSLGGLSKGAIYICTEDAFPSKRLNQLSQAFQRRFNTEIAYEDHIFVKHVVNYKQLHKCLSHDINPLLQLRNCGLIVIDSIAGIFRSEMDVDYVERSKQLTTLARMLSEHSKCYNCSIICINQISDSLNKEMNPCLGLTWSNLISYRLNVKKHNDARLLTIIFSPDLPNNQCPFTITAAGIV